MPKRKKILYIYSPWTTFTKTDYDIIATKYEVVKYHYKPIKGTLKTTLEILKQFVFLFFNIWKFSAVYIWFADTHSFLPILFARILHKKSFLVIGGYDVARIRDHGYGVFTNKMRGFFAKYSMNNCTINLTVSKYVDRKVKAIAKKADTQLIYNCITLDRSLAKKGIEKQDLIITVGIIEEEQTYYIKGIDTFIEVARRLPQYQFLIIGLNQEKLAHLLTDVPNNLLIKGKVPHPDLITYYQKAKIYCQLSRSESFGVALAEAMIFGSIPIVTNTGGLSEVVGNYGVILKDINDTPSKIKQIMKTPPSKEDTMNQVEKLFHFENRKKSLFEKLPN